jgi:hypothetical protein
VSDTGYGTTIVGSFGSWCRHVLCCALYSSLFVVLCGVVVCTYNRRYLLELSLCMSVRSNSVCIVCMYRQAVCHKPQKLGIASEGFPGHLSVSLTLLTLSVLINPPQRSQPNQQQPVTRTGRCPVTSVRQAGSRPVSRWRPHSTSQRLMFLSHTQLWHLAPGTN